MEELPVELVAQITECLDHTNKLIFRSVCKKVCEIVTPIAFKEIEVTHLPTSFANMTKISTSKYLGPHVKSLFYCGTLHPFLTFDEWVKCIRFPPNGQRSEPPEIPVEGFITEALALQYAQNFSLWASTTAPKVFYSSRELHAGYREYIRLVYGAKSFENTVYDFVSLRTCFQHLTNLKSLYVTTTNSTMGYMPSRQSREANLVEHKSSLLPCLSLRKGDKYGIRQTTSVLQAMLASLPKLEIVEFHEVHWLVIAKFFPRVAELGAFANVRYLELEIASGIKNATAETCANRQRILGRALKSAKNLESLSLWFDRSNGPILWSRIFSNETTWPSLRRLSISGIDVEPSLIDFFSRHSKIRSLKMKSLDLVGKSTWFRLFGRMRKILTLESFQLEGRFRLKYSGLWFSMEESMEMEDEDWDLNMDWGIGLLYGRHDDGKSLGEHIAHWFVSGGPSPLPSSPPYMNRDE